MVGKYGMLRKEGEFDLAKDFQAAHFEYRRANSSLRTASNATDDSAKGISSRNCKEGLKPLRAQLSILTHHLSQHEDDPVGLDLYGDLVREYAISSATICPPKTESIPDAYQQFETIMANITVCSSLNI